MRIKEEFVAATCALCGHTDRVNVALDDARLTPYLEGGLVQDVFPDLSTDEREVLICWRAEKGLGQSAYICNNHGYWEE